MTGLQEAFYIVGLVYMGLSLLIIIGILVGIGIIRKKIVSIENTIKEKLDVVTTITGRASEIVGNVKKLAKHKGK